MSKKKGLFTKNEIIGTSIVTESIKVELNQQTLFLGSRKCEIYQIIVNGDVFTSVDNREFAFYLLNDFDFKSYFAMKKCSFLEDVFYE